MGEAAIWCELGNLYMMLSAYDAAIYALEKAMALESENPRIFDSLALACHRIGRFDEAQAFFEKAMQLSEDDVEKAEILRHLGDLHVALRKYRRAAMVYETADLFASPATPIDPDSTPPPARPKLVTLPPQPTAQGDTSPERDELDFATSRPPTYPRSPSNGRSPYSLSLRGIRAATSSSHLDLAPQLDRQEVITDELTEPLAGLVPPPADPQPVRDSALEASSITGFGRAHEQSAPAVAEREPREIEVYRMITQANPANDRAWFTLGNNLRNHGRLAESVEAYETALALNPSAEGYHFELATGYAALRDYEKAAREFREVILLAPDNHFAHASLAACCRRLGDEDQMRKHAELVAPRMQQESNYNRACFESIRGNLERSLELLTAATREDGATLAMLESDPDLDFIRETPAYQQLVESLAPVRAGAGASRKDAP